MISKKFKSSLDKIIEIIKNIYIFIFTLLILFGIIESVTYVGFIKKHIKINTSIFIIPIVVMGLLLRFVYSSNKRFIPKVVHKFYLIYFATILIGYVLMSLVEEITYTNFMFSKFHVQYSNLLGPILLSLFLLLLMNINFDFLKKRGGWSLIFTVITFWLVATNIIQLNSMFRDSITNLIRHPFASYDDKMRAKLGSKFYNYILFINEYTPENSKLLIPPQAFPWPQTGNGAYMRYFIHPRDFANSKVDEKGRDLKGENIDYVLMLWGETEQIQYNTTHGWPKYNIPAEEIFILKDDGTVEAIKENYVYDNYKDQKVWGLIKVKK